jgi:ribosomal protein L18E
VRCSEIKGDAQCSINAAYPVEAKESDAVAEPASVRGCGLLGKYPRICATPISTTARKPAARADVDVGAISQVDSGS